MNKRVEIVAEKTLKVVEVPIPEPPPEGMIVKIHYAGVCHTDVHLWCNQLRMGDEETVTCSDFFRGSYIFPRVLVHEIAGEVYSIGAGDCPGATKFAVGDRVLVYPWRGCGLCGPCTKRRENLCPGPHSAYGVGRDGGYQAYMSVASRKEVQSLPGDIPMELACVLTCGALTTYNGNRLASGAIDQAHFLSGIARVLVVGAGGLGLWALKWAKALYPPNTLVYVADLMKEKLEMAKREGADGVILWEKSLTLEELKKRTMDVCGGEIDAAFDLVNTGTTAAAIQQCMKRGGCHVPTGWHGGTFKASTIGLAVGSRIICGACVGNSEQLAELAELVANKKVVSPPVTIHQPEQAEELLKKLHSGTLTGRAVLKFID